MNSADKKVFRKIISTNNRFIREHCLSGKPILAAAAYIHMALEALARQNRRPVALQLQDIEWINPLMISEDMELFCVLQASDGIFKIEFKSAKGKEATLHCRLVAVIEDCEGPKVSLCLPQASVVCNQKVPVEAIYQKFSAVGLQYGTAYQPISTLAHNGNIAFSQLVLPEDIVKLPESFISLLDGAFQVTHAAFVSREGPNRLMVPSRMKTLKLYQPIPENCCVLAEKCGDAVFNILVFNANGALVAEAEAFEGAGLASNSIGHQQPVYWFTRGWSDYSTTRSGMAPAFKEFEYSDEMATHEFWNKQAGNTRLRILMDNPYSEIGLFNQQSRRVFHLLKAMDRAGISPTLVQIVQVFRDTALRFLPDYLALHAMAQTARAENPVLQFLTLILGDEDNWDRDLPDSIDEKPCLLLRRKDKNFQAWSTLNVPKQDADASFKWKPGGVYYITGGHSLLAARLAAHICREAPAVVYLSGRKQQSPKISPVSGSEIIYLQGDCTDRLSLEKNIALIKERHTSITGIFHCAGILNDSLLVNKEWDQFQMVCTPKIQGVINLERITALIPVGFVMSFSSISSVNGNIGQSDYAAANAYLDGWAQVKNQDGNKCRWISINWPLLKGGSMNVAPALLAKWEQQTGIISLEEREWLTVVELALQSKFSQVIPLAGNHERIVRFLDPVREKESRPAGDNLQFLKAFMTRELKFEGISEDTPFGNLGMDSFLILKITRLLEKRYGPLPKTLFFQYTNLKQLVAYFDAHHKESAEEIAAPVTVPEMAPVFLTDESEIDSSRVSELLSRFGTESVMAVARTTIAPCLLVLADYSALCYFSISNKQLLVFGYAAAQSGILPLLKALEGFARQKDCSLTVLADEQMKAECEALGFGWAAFAAMQRIPDITKFSLSGNSMKRLRYQVAHFSKNANCETVEYIPGSDAAVNADLLNIIDVWCSRKSMVNPYIFQFKANLTRGYLPPQCRLFITRKNDMLKNAIVLTRYSSADGYLMDLEFYDDKDLDGGSLEFAIVKIIDQLRHEGVKVFSMGVTFGVKPDAGIDKDREAAADLQALRENHLFNGQGNFQFKNKFRPDVETVYLCRSKQLPLARVEDIILMIASPELVAASPELPVLPGVAAAIPMAVTPPLRVQAVQDNQRMRQLELCGFNPFNLPASDIEFDAVTDSWAEQDFPEQRKFFDRLLSGEYRRDISPEEALKLLFPFEHLVLVSQGRRAEAWLCREIQKDQHAKVPQNILFPTYIYHQVNNEMEPLEIPLEPSADEIFLGNPDLSKLADLLAKREKVAFVCIELANNAMGGAPVSLKCLQQVKEMLRPFKIPLVIDATRIIDNSICIRQYEHPGQSIAQIMKAICATADHLTASLPKNFGVEAGAFIATRDIALFTALQQAVYTEGISLGKTARQLIVAAAQSLPLLIENVSRRQQQVKQLAEVFIKFGLNPVWEPRAHAVLFNPKSWQGWADIQHPAPSFIAWLYLLTGLRTGRHNGGRDPRNPLHGYVRLALPIGIGEKRMADFLQQIELALAARHDILELISEGKPQAMFGEMTGRFRLKESSVQTEIPVTIAAKEPQGHTDEPIAIVGVSIRFPKAASPEEFWEILRSGTDCIIEIPGERWDYKDQKNPKGQWDTKWGGFIDGVDEFDPLFFNISPKEAECMDPQERLFLQTAFHALEDAGYYPESFARKYGKTGVFVGAVWGLYQLIGAEATRAGNPSLANSFHWGIANRVSYCFNFTGPSMSVDTACSSSLTALHLACESMFRGECQAAIVGGVNLDIHPAKPLITNAAKALSPDGRCRSFGENANGYVAGEGVAALVLKPRSKALADGDHVYGLIRSTSINHGGRTNNYTVPNPAAQAELMKAAIEKAGVPAISVNYVEAHGTGTALGDPIEIVGITQALDLPPEIRDHCGVGSVKSNIGHLEAAAGLAGIVKVLLQFRHFQIAPSLHSQVLNPYIDFSNGPLYVPQQLSEWRAVPDGRGGNYPLRALVSSFGAGGSNGQVLLESAEPFVTGYVPEYSDFLLLLSGRTETTLLEYAANLRLALQQLKVDNEKLFMERLAYTFQTGRKPMEYRLALIGCSVAEWMDSLNVFLSELEGDERKIAKGVVNKKTLLKLQAPDDDVLHTWLRNRQLTELAGAWLNGVEVPWEKMYREPVQRLSFTRYPFERNRYWVDLGQPAVAPEVFGNELHAEFAGDQHFTTQIHPHTNWIRDHVVAGDMMLPGVAYIEMGRFALEKIIGSKVTGISNIVWSDPVTVNGHSIEICLDVREKKAKWQYDVYSFRDGKRVLHSQGKLSKTKIADTPVQKFNLDEIRGRCDRHKTEEEVYAGLKAHGIDHRYSFRVLQSLHYNSEEGLAKIDVPNGLMPEFGKYVLHPSVMDGALQAAAAISQSSETGTGIPDIPFVVKELTVFRVLKNECFAYVKRLPGNNPQVKKFDIVLMDETGQILAEIREFSVATLQKTKSLEDADHVVKEESKQQQFDKIELSAMKQQKPEETQDGEYTMGFFTEEWLENPVATSSIDKTIISWGQDEKITGQFPKARVCRLSASSSQPEWETFWLGLKLADDAQVEIVRWPLPLLKNDAEWMEQEVIAALFCLQSFRKSYPEARARLAILFRNSDAPCLKAFSAFGSSIMQESRLLQCYTLSADDNTALVQALVKELNHDRINAVAYFGGRRLEKKLVQYSPPSFNGTLPGIVNGGVYLITGGAGGIGRLLVEYLLSVYRQITIVVTGRSEQATAEWQRLADAASNGQSKLIYHSCDVTKEPSVRALFNFIQANFKTLNGVMHAAGVNHDSLFMNKSYESFIQTLRPKTLGTQLLIKYCETLKPDFFLAFSSIAAITGNAGQTDYSFANAFMDACITEMRGQKGNCLFASINWPLWKSGGMSINADVEKYLEKKTGMVPLPARLAMEALERLFNPAARQALPVYGKLERFSQFFDVKTPNTMPAQQSVPVPIPVTAAIQADVSPVQLREAITKEVLQLVSSLLKVNPKDLSAEKDMSDYGADSTSLTEFSNLLNDKFNSDITPAVFFEFSSIQGLADHLIDEYAEELEAFYKQHYHSADLTIPEPTSEAVPEITSMADSVIPSTGASQRREDIAIIGLAGKFPDSDTPEELWENMIRGIDMIRDIPEDRFNWKDYVGDIREINKMISPRGGFIRDMDKFDPLFFGIAPSEAEFMDPQQRVFLETVWHTIENAGYRPEDLSNSKTGVFVGLATSDYYEILHRTYPEIQAHSTTGNAHSVLPNRISYLLNLRGPSEPVDTACSSSLVAIHRAIQSIYNGDCDQAIAGGVGIMLTATTFIAFSKAGMLSPDGLCKTFSNRANGYVRGEGSSAVLLKPLSRAIADKDHIHAVIRGSSINHGGKAASLTAPNPNAQSELLVEAYTKSGIDPATISYIEAHGTGTPLGDPVEINALKKAFGTMLGKEKGSAKPSIGVGSVKSHIGHLEAAAGIAGLTKLVLSLQHKKLPATRHCEEINDYIRLDGTRFFILRENAEWEAFLDANGQALPRRCGVSSFGFGGVNAHVILEEYPQPDGLQTEPGPLLFVFSAKEEESLRNQLIQMERWLLNVQAGKYPFRLTPQLFLNISFTLMEGRSAYQYRTALVARSFEELLDSLHRAISDMPDPFCVSGQPEVSGLSGYEEVAPTHEHLLAAARSWVNGHNINWTKIFKHLKVNRTPIPGYAFLREKYWIPYTLLKQNHFVEGTPVVPTVVSQLKLHTKSFVLHDTDLWPSMHRVNNRCMMPGAACLNLIYETAKESSGMNWPIQFEDILWERGMYPGNSLTVKAGLDGKSIMITGNDDGSVYVTGLLSSFERTPPHPADYRTLMSSSTISRKGNDVYQAFKTVGFDYGASLQVIKEQFCHAEYAVSRLEVVAGDRLIPMIDGAFQAIDGIIPEGGWTNERLSVARGVGRLIIFGELPPALWACVTKTVESEANGKKVRHFDIQLIDDANNVLVEINDFRIQALKEQTVQLNPRLTPVQQPASSGSIHSKAIAYFSQELAQALRLPVSRIKPQTGFESYGIDSFIINSLTNTLQQAFPGLSKTLFFEISNLSEMADYFVRQFPGQLEALVGENQEKFPVEPSDIFLEQNSEPAPQLRDDEKPLVQSTNARPGITDIAIVGIGGRYPQAANLQEFWDNLQQGRDCISTIPLERWDNRQYFDEDKEKMGRIYTQWGGFMDGVEKFDALFFSIAPREAETLDPNERLFLRTVWEALEDAGYNPDNLRFSESGKNIGVYVGVMWGFYAYYGLEEAARQNYISANSPFFSIPNRVSYYFDWQGPSLAIDSACSSSLTAIHLAYESLRTGECQMAVAGGVNLTLHSRKYVELCQNKFLSTDGRCRSFGEGGDGYVPGEGVGAVILKPLEHAISDGDHIYGVIRASSINHGGKTNGFSVPSPKAQSRLIAQTLERAGIHPETISYIETHGTGTSLGDPIEMAGLNYAFKEKTHRLNYCAIGSVKSNIGHLEAAAGIASLTKTVLQMQYNKLVPSLHAKNINPNLDFSNSPFYLQRETAPWLPSAGGLVRAGISSFGAGGSNAHMILEAYNDAYSAPAASGEYIICLSAKNLTSLEKNVRNLLGFIRNTEYWGKQQARISLPNIAFTCFTGRRHFAQRLAIVASSLEELDAQLMHYLRKRNSTRLFAGKASVEPNDAILTDDNVYQMAAAWVKGTLIRIEWGDYPCRRLSLPAYAFDEKRYWVPAAGPDPAALQQGPNGIVPKMKPEVEGQKQDICVFSAGEPLLQQHCFKGQMIKPGMADICLALEAANTAGIGSLPVVENFRWLAPLALAEGQTVQSRIKWQVTGKAFSFSLEALDQVLSSGTVVASAPMPDPQFADLARLIGTGIEMYTGDTIYSHFRKLGMQYGNFFRGLDTIWKLEDGTVLSRVIPPAGLPEGDQAGKPFIIDAFCQTLVGIAAGVSGLSTFAGVPLSIDRLIQHRAWFNQPEYWVHAGLKGRGILKPNAAKAVFDIQVYDELGNPCLSIEGLAVHFVREALVRHEQPAFYGIEWRENPGVRQSHCNQVWLAAPANGGLAEQITTCLQMTGCSVSVLDGSNLFGETTGWRHLFAGKPPESIILVDDGKQQDTTACNTLISLSHGLAKVASPVKVIYAYPADDKSLSSAMACGIALAIAGEMPHTLRLVQYNENDPETARKLAAELSIVTDAVDIRLVDDKRWESFPCTVEAGNRKEELLVRKGGNYIISGGSGKLGRIVAKWLADCFGANCLLTGRREPDEELNAFLEQLKSKGVKAGYMQLLFDGREEVEKLKSMAKQLLGPVHGIFHTAGFSRDGLLEHKEHKDFWEVLHPKYRGLQWLDEVFANEQLDFFLMFSSIASLFKNPGQADYASANYFMDQYAVYRNQLTRTGRRSGLAVSVNWSLWKEGGMKVPEKIKRMIAEKTGLVELDTASGLAALEAVLSMRMERVIVLPGNQEKLKAAFGIKDKLKTDSGEVIDALLERLDREEIEIDDILLQLETL